MSSSATSLSDRPFFTLCGDGVGSRICPSSMASFSIASKPNQYGCVFGGLSLVVDLPFFSVDITLPFLSADEFLVSLFRFSP